MKAAKPFFFKQFKIEQEGATMKVNTDGVLLAALATHNRPKRILDIGTGTGLISMMMAQRFPDAFIEALEPDPTSHGLAAHNFSASPFSDRLLAWPVKLEEFQTEEASFDLMVSNPPYFLNALKSDHPSKRLARHTDQAFFNALFDRSLSWLNPEGSLQLIVPHQLSAWLIELGKERGYRMDNAWEISSFPKGPIIRNILCFSRIAGKSQRTSIHLYEAKGVYSPFYKELLAPYFLNF